MKAMNLAASGEAWTRSGFLPQIMVGIGVLEPAVLGFIPEGSGSDFSRDVVPRVLANEQTLFGYRLAANEGLW